MSAPAEWFREWFGETYLSLYPHRDEAEAAAGVALYLRHASHREGDRVLDLACGAGRHLEPLRDAGLRPVGIDLSATLLTEAAGRAGARGSLARGDMRALPFADGAFHGLVNFFTSFGYFRSHDDDARVLAEMRRVLRPGAPFIMDYLNAPWVRARLRPESRGELDGRPVVQTRWVEGDQVFKRIEIGGDDGRPPEVFHERVRLYSAEALEGLLRAARLIPEARYGGYGGEPHSQASPRLLVLGSAT